MFLGPLLVCVKEKQVQTHLPLVSQYSTWILFLYKYEL